MEGQPPPPPEDRPEPPPLPPPKQPGADAAPPAPPPDAPPPPPRSSASAAPPPPPPRSTVCASEGCGAKLSEATRCGLCLPCRFKVGNPFLPGKLLCSTVLKAQATNVLNVPLLGNVDFRTGRLKVGILLEVRCLRVDAPEWRYELGHSWPAGISLFVDDQRVLLRKPDAEHDENPGPFNLTNFAVRKPLEVNPRPVKVSAAISAKRSEQWALGVLLIQPLEDIDELCKRVASKQAPLEERMQQDLERVRAWVTYHRPDRVSKKDMLRCVEPPVLKLVCCTSLSRIEQAARGVDCDHLQCFDLGSYLHTMRNIPPKHAWCCPVCDKPTPLHQLRLDAFAQSVIDGSEANVTEVLVADNGKWEVSATEDPQEDDSSEDELPFARPPTQADLQAAALNLGRAFAAPTLKPAPRLMPQREEAPPRQVEHLAHQQQRDGSRSPRRKAERGAHQQQRDRSRSPRGKDGRGPSELPPPAEKSVDKMVVWEKLQGIAKPEPVKEETRIGWLPDKSKCSKCEKAVVEKGGVYCGRRRPSGECGGCFVGICWKCMNKSGKELGSVRTTKAEFASLGPDAWWMHEACMSAEDKRAYFGEEEEESANKRGADDSDDEHPGKFEWE